jgi:hypothetical protein
VTRPRTPSEILDAAGDLLAQPGAWTQGGAGRDGEGRLVSPENIEKAVCFCGVGAVWRVAGPFEEVKHFVMREIFPLICHAVGIEIAFGNWNDHKARTQSEVVAAFRKAAAQAREAGE